MRNTLIGLLLMTVSMVMLTFLALQTPPVREWLRNFIIETANNTLAAKVEFSDFGGNLIGGVTFDDVRIIAAGDTVLSAKLLTIRYDLQALLTQSIVINRIALEEPIIKILRASDSTWNIAHIVKPPADTTQKRPFSWGISIRDISMYAGTVIVRDSTLPESRFSESRFIATTNGRDRVNLAHFRLDSVALSVAATLRFKDQRHAITLNHFAFNDYASRLFLKNLAFGAAIDSNHAEVFNLRLQTAESALHLNAVMDSVNFFKRLAPGAWKQKPVQISLNADSVSSRDLQRFSPTLDVLGGAPSLKLEARGTVGDIRVERLNIAGSFMAAEGRIENLNVPENIYITAKLHQMNINDGEVRHYLPGLKLPNLVALGAVQVESGSFTGEPKSFHATLRASSAVGAIDADATLDMRSDTMKYIATLQTTNLNLAPITRDDGLKSSLNTTVTMNGQGTTLKQLVSTLRLEAGASEFAGRAFDSMVLNAHARDGGYITLDMLKITWLRRADFDEYDFDNPNARTALNSSQLLGSGWLNLQDIHTPQYKLDLRTANLDLMKIVPTLGVQSDATMQINIIGKGFHPDSLSGNLHINAQEFVSDGKDYGPFTFNTRMERHSDINRTLTITSPEIADAKVSGQFSFAPFMKAFASQVDNVVYEVRRKYHLMRDSTHFPVTEGMFIKAPTEAETVQLNANFTIKARDLSLIDLFTGSGKVFGVGEMNGSVRGTSRQYLFQILPSQFDSFRYTDGEVTVDLLQTKVNGEFYNQTFGDSLKSIGGLLHIQCDSAFRYDDKGDEWVFPHSSMDARYSSDNLAFDVNAECRDYLRFHVQGAFDMSSKNGRLMLDTATLWYQPKYEKNLTWNNAGTLDATLTCDGLMLNKFRVKRTGAETIDADGLVWLEHFRDAHFVVSNMAMQDINRLLPRSSRVEVLNPLRGHLDKMDVIVNGFKNNPDIRFLMNADTLLYNGWYVGHTSISGTHRDSVVRGTAQFTNLLRGDSTRMLTVEAKAFPLNLAFTSVEERITDHRPIDVRFDADAFPLGAFSLFIPGVNNVKGSVQARMGITGETHDNIIYRGEANLSKVSFITESTNMRYFADGKMKLLNSNVTIEGFNIYNDSLDYPRGRGFASGTATLKGFDIALFDISAQIPQLMVLSDASRITHPSLYGDVVMQTGTKPLHFYGTLEEPYLRGDVNVLSGKVFFPDSKSVKREFKPFCFERVVEQGGKRMFIERDCGEQEYATIESKKEPLHKPEYEEHVLDSGVVNIVTKPRSPSDNKVQSQPSSPSLALLPTTNISGNQKFEIKKGFSDKIDFDINVYMKGNFFLTMDFGPTEQLLANIGQENPNLPLRYVQKPDNPDEPTLFGNVRVKDGSKYNFYRIFNATGTMAFNTGNISNPQVNLNATLRGQRVNLTGNGTEEYTVLLDVTGTKKVPTVKITYFIGMTPGVGDPVKVQNDAIMLMVFGKRQEELQSLGKGLGEVATAQSSSVASKLLTDLLQGTGFIRSADVYFANAQNSASVLDLAQARVQLTTEISGVILQVGNEIRSDNAVNPSFTIDVPLSTFLNLAALKNVALQVTRSAINANALTRQQRDLEFKLSIMNKW